MGINLVSATVIAGMFAIITYNLKMLLLKKSAGAADDDDEEEVI